MKKSGLVKLLRCAVAAVLLVSCMLPLFAANAETVKTRYPGDINGDGAVTAGDARLALRLAVRLSTTADEIADFADADGNGSITAADARLILRVAVGLQSQRTLPSFTTTAPYKGDTIDYWRKEEMATLKMDVGETYTVKRDYVRRAGSQFSWKSSNPAVATVTNGGKITAKAKGFACVYLTLGANRYYYYVNVRSALQKRIYALQNKYPDGYYWNAHTKSKKYPAVSEIPCTDHASGTYRYCIGQCAGFAALLSNEVFGKNAPTYRINSVNDIKIGDYLRCLPHHSVFVIDKVSRGEIYGYDIYGDRNLTADSGRITIAECNWDWHCGISWGRTIWLDDLSLEYSSCYSRYR